MPFSFEYSTSKDEVVRPKALEKMLEIATSLSEGMPFVRVDLYEVNAKILFGEMTFYPENCAGRFRPKSYDNKLGELLELPAN